MNTTWEALAAQKTTEVLQALGCADSAAAGAPFPAAFDEALRQTGWTPAKAPVCRILRAPFAVDTGALAGARYLVVTAYNAAHTDLALAALTGADWGCLQPCTTAACLDRQMETLGFVPLQAADVKGRWRRPEDASTIAPDGDTLLRQFVEDLKSRTDAEADSVLLVRAFARQQAETLPPASDTKPFLSVLTRTQGTREQELREVLQCLARQEDRDFELLLVGHQLAAEGLRTVEKLIAETPAWQQARIRLLREEASGRWSPLNRGVTAANGSYLAILDDDDLVKPDWVRQFADAAARAPGRVLHAYAEGQPWQRTADGTLQPLGEAAPIFCKPFQWKNQFVENNCPTLSLAFPVYVFQKLGMRFAALNACEDWQLTMRAAMYCGVEDIPAVTAVYRLWKGGGSLALHGREEWARCYEQVTGTFDKSPLLLPAGAESFLLRQSIEHGLSWQPADTPCQLQLPAEGPTPCAEQTPVVCGRQLRCDFAVSPVAAGSLALTLTGCAGAALREVMVTVHSTDDQVLRLQDDDLLAECYRLDGWLAFPDRTPRLECLLPAQWTVCRVELHCLCEHTMPQILLQNILHNKYVSSARLFSVGETYQGPLPGSYTVREENHIQCSWQPVVGPVRELRFVPALRGGVVVQQFSAAVYDAGGRLLPLRWRHNGLRLKDADIFCGNAVYRCRLPAVALSRVEISMVLTGYIPDATAAALTPRWKRLLRRLLDRK